MKLHIHICIHTRVHTYIHIYVHVCMYVCMYTYMYHMCTYIHTCIHMYSYHVYMCVVMYKHCKSCPCQSGSTRVQLRLQKNTHVTLLKKITRNKSQSHQITDHRGTNLFFIIFLICILLLLRPPLIALPSTPLWRCRPHQHSQRDYHRN